MASAPDAIDRASFGVVLGLFALGAIWLTVLLWPWRGSKGRPERVNSKLKKTLRSRRGTTHAALSKRVHLLFAKAKRLADAVRVQSMEMNTRISRCMPPSLLPPPSSQPRASPQPAVDRCAGLAPQAKQELFAGRLPPTCWRLP
jgi:hypothetical protein